MVIVIQPLFWTSFTKCEASTKHDALLDGIGKNKHSGTPKLEFEVQRVCTIDGSPHPLPAIYTCGASASDYTCRPNIYYSLYIYTSSSLTSFAYYLLPDCACSAAAPQIVPTFSVRHLYQRTCTVELLIRVLPLSYALMRGTISPLILWLVQFRLVSETGLEYWNGLNHHTVKTKLSLNF